MFCSSLLIVNCWVEDGLGVDGRELYWEEAEVRMTPHAVVSWVWGVRGSRGWLKRECRFLVHVLRIRWYFLNIRGSLCENSLGVTLT